MRPEVRLVATLVFMAWAYAMIAVLQLPNDAPFDDAERAVARR